MESPRLETVCFTVELQRQPRKWMPVGGFERGERPLDVRNRQTRAYVGVVDDVIAVVQAEKLGILAACTAEGHEDAGEKANRDEPRGQAIIAPWSSAGAKAWWFGCGVG